MVRPLLATHKYDLDNVTTLQIAKARTSQTELKTLYDAEIRAYAIAHEMTDPVGGEQSLLAFVRRERIQRSS